MFKKGDKVRTVNEKFSEEDFGGYYNAIKTDTIYIIEDVKPCSYVNSRCLKIYKCSQKVKLLNIPEYKCFGHTQLYKYLLTNIDKFEEHKQRMLNV